MRNIVKKIGLDVTDLSRVMEFKKQYKEYCEKWGIVDDAAFEDSIEGLARLIRVAGSYAKMLLAYANKHDIGAAEVMNGREFSQIG